MASKRARKRHECERKQKYTTKEEAEERAMEVRRKTGSPHVDAFRCTWCKSWHYGNRPDWLARQMQERRRR